jgi:hypothetical protein
MAGEPFDDVVDVLNGPVAEVAEDAARAARAADVGEDLRVARRM